MVKRICVCKARGTWLTVKMLGTCRAVFRCSATRGQQVCRLQSTLAASSASRTCSELPPLLAALGSKSTAVPPPQSGQSNNEIMALTHLASRLQLRPDISRPQAYRLPTAVRNQSVIKHTILDPVTSQKLYDLPCHIPLIREKVTPATDLIQPISDPARSPVLKIETMPYLVNIRHKKMKKHKLKKFRKRMIFLHRKLSDIKKKRKEKAMVAIERSFATSAREFDAETYIEGHIKEAKRGAWKIDVIQKWKESKTPQVVEADKQQ